jgi:hypothetical protein
MLKKVTKSAFVTMLTIYTDDTVLQKIYEESTSHIGGPRVENTFFEELFIANLTLTKMNLSQ